MSAFLASSWVSGDFSAFAISPTVTAPRPPLDKCQNAGAYFPRHCACTHFACAKRDNAKLRAQPDQVWTSKCQSAEGCHALPIHGLHASQRKGTDKPPTIGKIADLTKPVFAGIPESARGRVITHPGKSSIPTMSNDVDSFSGRRIIDVMSLAPGASVSSQGRRILQIVLAYTMTVCALLD
ncbi:hypothetical protein [Asaia bogorensis]|uniref:hypothetical protein n=1 Tax=Asaia bogorensis TaxID=91915 RepID=UPI0011BE5DA5|nr:hypothetical protein [Asaia bogorensis]